MKNHRSRSKNEPGAAGPERRGASVASRSGDDAEWWKEVVEIAAGVRARELRVDEARGVETTQGESTTVREGLPPTGAVEGVTYRNVRVQVKVCGRPPR